VNNQFNSNYNTLKVTFTNMGNERFTYNLKPGTTVKFILCGGGTVTMVKFTTHDNTGVSVPLHTILRMKIG